MAAITVTQIHALLTEVGRRYPLPATLTLLGGCALCLLGSTRPTLDIDYVGHDSHKNELQQVIDLVAQEMQMEVEAVPIDGFIPLPSDSLQRQLPAGNFGSISVYILDPYSIALSKIDRGLDSDLADVVFLIRQGFITLKQLEVVVQSALPHAKEFSMNPTTMQEHIEDVKHQLSLLNL